MPGRHAVADAVGVGVALGQQLGGERARGRALAGAGAARGRGRRARASPAERGAQHHPRVRVVLGPGERGARSRRRPRAGARLDRRHHVGVHLLGRAVGVDPRASAPGSARGQLLVGRAHRSWSAAPSSSKRSSSAPRARGRASGRASSRNVRSGTSPPVAQLLMRCDLLHAQAARGALVGERGVEVAVGDHHAALPRAPGGSPARTSSARAAANSSASASAAELERRVLEQLAHPLAHRGAARLAHADGARRRARRSSIPAWVRLARAVDPLERDEQAGIGGDGTSGGRAPTGVLAMPRLMRALVTGGAGFIGSNLVDALLERGDEVTVLDDLSTGRRENLDGALAAGAELRRGSTSATPRRWRDLVRARAARGVFHLAAQIDVRQSAADPAFDARMNVEGTINVLEAARAGGGRGAS